MGVSGLKQIIMHSQNYSSYSILEQRQRSGLLITALTAAMGHEVHSKKLLRWMSADICGRQKQKHFTWMVSWNMALGKQVRLTEALQLHGHLASISIHLYSFRHCLFSLHTQLNFSQTKGSALEKLRTSGGWYFMINTGKRRQSTMWWWW